MWIESLVDAAASRVDSARESLWSRGVSDEQIGLYRIGHLSELPSQIDYPQTFLDVWRRGNRSSVFVLPLTNTVGQVKGLQLRHSDKDVRGYSTFVLSPEEPVYFGLAQAMVAAWSSRSVWLVEGAFDVFPIQRVFPAVLSTMTADLSDTLARTLHRVVDEVYVGYDADPPGQRGVATIRKKHGKTFRVCAPQWPRVQRLDGKGPVKDPSDLWEAWGDERLGPFLRSLV
jgi:hypothetical protein